MVTRRLHHLWVMMKAPGPNDIGGPRADGNLTRHSSSQALPLLHRPRYVPTIWGKCGYAIVIQPTERVYYRPLSLLKLFEYSD